MCEIYDRGEKISCYMKKYYYSRKVNEIFFQKILNFYVKKNSFLEWEEV